ncbi:MAG: hypothetical protein H6Q90_3474 [Deltaproteobacteria bacterium]|nr:hypothetical protein [Deltaproteobacteria bacterium]
MGEAPCDLLEAELALDRLEAELAAELPGHVRAFARAHSLGMAPPPAPGAARRPGSLASARRALVHPELADRALATMRLLIPIAIDDDAQVANARAGEATWQGLERLATARDLAAQTRLGLGFVELVHRLHGSAGVAASAPAVPPPLEGWHARGERLDVAAIERAWQALAARHGARGTLRFAGGIAGARSRAFIVEPGREVTAIVPRTVDTPAARFEVLHELGHAVAALVVSVALPRVVDEAVAAYVARALEVADDLEPAWHSPLAALARERRAVVAAALDAVERRAGAPALPSERPPWALWHDPGAQAAYVQAEQLAARWWSELGPRPGPGALATAIVREVAAIDRSTVL